LTGGEEKTAIGLTEEILRYRNYLTGGVTFSGGEPLVQAEYVRAVTELLHRQAGIHVAIDTSGIICSPEALEAIDAADLILLDIKAFREETAIQLTGSNTRNAMMILEHCEKKHKPVWIRCVLVPGFTIFDTTEDGALIKSRDEFIQANPDFCDGISRISRYSCVEKIELLPFHKMGEFKWRELGLISPLENTPEPSESGMDFARSIVDDYYC
jgi:pyruvate formate lyase activating enzyme